MIDFDFFDFSKKMKLVILKSHLWGNFFYKSLDPSKNGVFPFYQKLEKTLKLDFPNDSKYFLNVSIDASYANFINFE